ncbi:MAG: glycerate kinase type-2 family protein [Bacteroidota bacterium]
MSEQNNANPSNESNGSSSSDQFSDDQAHPHSNEATQAKYKRHRSHLQQIFHYALEETEPSRLVRKHISFDAEHRRLMVGEQEVLLSEQEQIWVIGAGKAGGRMAEACEEVLGDAIKDGIVIIPHNDSDQFEQVKAIAIEEGVSRRRANRKLRRQQRIQRFEASHPLPDEDSVAASYELQSLTKRIGVNDVVLFLLSGGASSLLCLPAGNLELEDIRITNQQLLRAGCSIREINTVRKHMSAIKGGQLLQYLKDARVYDLVISDVPGDDPEIIGSGPTTTDSTTFTDAFQVLKRYQLWDQIPHTVRAHIAKGMHGGWPDTPKPGSDMLCDHTNYIIGSARIFARKCAQKAEELGYHTWFTDSPYDDDVRSVSKQVAAQSLQVLKSDEPVAKPGALVFYGESTVEVDADGKGGRNQELALTTALSLEGQHHISILAAGTDGIDGPTNAAGGLVNALSTLTARSESRQPEEYLRRHDAYHFLQENDELLITGPTGNNVMDIVVALIEK